MPTLVPVKYHYVSQTLLGGSQDVNRRSIYECECSMDGKPVLATERVVCVLNLDMRPWSPEHQRDLKLIMDALRKAAVREPDTTSG